MRKNEDWRLESFDWLPIGEWSVEKLIGPYLQNQYGTTTQGCCKICDSYIDAKELESHVKMHLKEHEKMVKRKKREADKRRKETLRLAREERQRNKDRDKRERQYQDGELDE